MCMVALAGLVFLLITFGKISRVSVISSIYVSCSNLLSLKMTYAKSRLRHTRNVQYC